MRSLVLVDPYICHQLSAPSIPIHPNAIRQTDRSRQLTVFVNWGLDELWRLHNRSIMFFTHRLLLTLMCIAFTLPFVESAYMNAQNRLYHNLTDATEYVKYLRPVNDSYQSVDVGFRFDPFIHYLDYSNQELQLRGLMVMTWYDLRLSWNPDNYDDLDYIELTLTEIWRPELILYERLSKHSDESFQFETDIVKVYYTGKVDWVTIASTRTFCSIDVLKFPKDEHTCDVTFTTWLHQDNEQNLHHVGNMDPCHIENLRWNLQFTVAEGNESLYRCDQYLKKQSFVRYIAKLVRVRTQFDMFTLVAPNIFVSLLSVLTNCFPRGDSNGPAFGLMCLLALIIQLSILYHALPDTGFCIVGIYIASLIVIVVLETIFSVINMNIEDITYFFCKTERSNSNYVKLKLEMDDMTPQAEEPSVKINPPEGKESDQTGQEGSDPSKGQTAPNPDSYQNFTPPPDHPRERNTSKEHFVKFLRRCNWVFFKIFVTVFFGITILVVDIVMFITL